MFGVGVNCMMVVVIVVMIVAMGVRVIMGVLGLKAAHASAEGVAQFAVGHIRPRCRGALAFDVVVMGFLNCADFGFETNNLNAVFAQHAGGRRCV